MENPIELKPLEPLNQPKADAVKISDLSNEPEKKHKGLTLGKIITISTGVLLIAVVIGVVIYSQSGARFKGETPVLTHMVAPEETAKDQTALPSEITDKVTTTETVVTTTEISPENIIPKDEEIGVAGVDTSITDLVKTDVSPEVISPETTTTTTTTTTTLPEGIIDNLATAPTKVTDDGIYRDDSQMIPLAPGTNDAVVPEALINPEMQNEFLGAFKEACDGYNAELDYAYYHDDWTGTEKSYAASLTQLKNNRCLSECDYAFYDGILQLHSENYQLDYVFDPMNPTSAPQAVKPDISAVLSQCTDKCDKMFDLYAYFVKYAQSQNVYAQNDKDMMHYLIDTNIRTCEQCMELENPVFNESKYFSKEFDSLLDKLRTNYGDTYLKYSPVYVNPENIKEMEPNLGPLTYIPVAYAASEKIKTSEATFSPNDAVISASTAVANDIKAYLEEKCPEPEQPVIPAECTEVHFVDPGNPATRINSFDAVYNERIANEPLLVQATGLSGNVRYLFSTDTPIDPNFQFTDTINTGNPLTTDSPRINLSTTDIATAFDQISVTVVDENNNPVGTCTDQISLMLADSAGIAEEIPETITDSTTTTTTTTTTGGTSGGGTLSGTTTTSSSSGSSSGGTAGGTIPRCNYLEIINPVEANADGTPTVNITENGYLDETLKINISTSSGVVNKYRFKSLNGTISFNNQGTSVDVSSTTKSVKMNGGPDAGQQDTVTVWALNDSNSGIQSCHDAFIVNVPVAQVAGAPAAESEPSESETVIPAEHNAAPVEEEIQEEEPAPLPVVHEGAETPAEPEETMPPSTPEDGPGVLVYFIGAGLGGLIFSRKKKNK